MTENNDKKTVTLRVEEYDELIAKAGSQELAERSLTDNKNEADRHLADSRSVAAQNTADQSTADQKKAKVKTGHLSSMINYSDRF